MQSPNFSTIADKVYNVLLLIRIEPEVREKFSERIRTAFGGITPFHRINKAINEKTK